MPLSLPQSPADPQTEAARWLARRHSGDYTADEQQRYLRWLNASEANRKAYEDAERLWEELGGLGGVAARQLGEARLHLAQARRSPLYRRAYAVSVVALFVAAFAWSVGWLTYSDDRTFRTARGERQMVPLADGSKLELDTDSEVAVHYSRRVRELTLLRGQAAFTVAHGDSRPFDVLAGKVRVHDIATQFDVRRYPDRVAVSVLEGAVEVTGHEGADPQLLRQGQRVAYSLAGDATEVEAVDIADAAAWRQSRLVFRGQTLGEVLAELGRYHSAALTIASPRLMDIKVSGSFPTNDIQLALKTIAATLPVNLTKTGPQSWRLGGAR